MSKQINPQKTDRIAKIWIPIIVALIGLAGVIITVIFTTSPPPDPTPIDPATDGFVYSVTILDSDTKQPIDGAHILIEIGGGLAPKDAYTDSNGSTRITIDSSQSGKQARLIISADNYQRQTYDIDLTSDALPNEVRLDPE